MTPDKYATGTRVSRAIVAQTKCRELPRKLPNAAHSLPEHSVVARRNFAEIRNFRTRLVLTVFLRVAHAALTSRRTNLRKTENKGNVKKGTSVLVYLRVSREFHPR